MCVYINSLDFCYRNKILSLEPAIGFPAYTLLQCFVLAFTSLKGIEKLKLLAKQSPKIIFFCYIS